MADMQDLASDSMQANSTSHDYETPLHTYDEAKCCADLATLTELCESIQKMIENYYSMGEACGQPRHQEFKKELINLMERLQAVAVKCELKWEKANGLMMELLFKIQNLEGMVEAEQHARFAEPDANSTFHGGAGPTTGGPPLDLVKKYSEEGVDPSLGDQEQGEKLPPPNRPVENVDEHPWNEIGMEDVRVCFRGPNGEERFTTVSPFSADQRADHGVARGLATTRFIPSAIVMRRNELLPPFPET